MPSRISQMRSGMPPQATQQSPQVQTQVAPSQQINTAYLNQIKALMRSKNSTELLANMAAQNPQMRQVLQMIQNGANPQVLAQQMAQARGIDLNTLMKQLME